MDIEDNKMVSEGSMFPVQYYNEKETMNYQPIFTYYINKIVKQFSCISSRF